MADFTLDVPSGCTHIAVQVRIQSRGLRVVHGPGGTWDNFHHPRHFPPLDARIPRDWMIPWSVE